MEMTMSHPILFGGSFAIVGFAAASFAFASPAGPPVPPAPAPVAAPADVAAPVAPAPPAPPAPLSSSAQQPPVPRAQKWPPPRLANALPLSQRPALRF